nr:ADP-glucose pyrophosphorylase small subunit 2 [Ipomoea batatas]GME03580.1 ADP-glucose pyrophosphorylase small subunit 2 [Ipomoea batatas]
MSTAIGAPKLAPYTCAAERNGASALRAPRFKSLSFASSNLFGDKLVSLVSRCYSRSGGKSSERRSAPIIVSPSISIHLQPIQTPNSISSQSHLFISVNLNVKCSSVRTRRRGYGLGRLRRATGASLVLLNPVPAGATTLSCLDLCPEKIKLAQ